MYLSMEIAFKTEIFKISLILDDVIAIQHKFTVNIKISVLNAISIDEYIVHMF